MRFWLNLPMSCELYCAWGFSSLKALETLGWLFAGLITGAGEGA